MRGGGAPSRWEMKREVMLAPVGVLDLRLVALRAVGMDEGVEAGEPRVRAVPLLAKLSHRLRRICHPEYSEGERPRLLGDDALLVRFVRENQQQLLERHAVVVHVVLHRHAVRLAPVFVVVVKGGDGAFGPAVAADVPGARVLSGDLEPQELASRALRGVLRERATCGRVLARVDRRCLALGERGRRGGVPPLLRWRCQRGRRRRVAGVFVLLVVLGEEAVVVLALAQHPRDARVHARIVFRRRAQRRRRWGVRRILAIVPHVHRVPPRARRPCRRATLPRVKTSERL